VSSDATSKLLGFLAPVLASYPSIRNPNSGSQRHSAAKRLNSHNSRPANSWRGHGEGDRRPSIVASASATQQEANEAAIFKAVMLRNDTHAALTAAA